MKKSLWLVLGIIGLVIIIGGVGIWAFQMIDSIYTYRSPIANTPPTPGDPLGSPITRRLVFVLIDGERLDTSLNAEVMPTLAHLREIGASATMHSQAPTFSQVSYTVLLTGAWPYLNDGPVFNADYPDIWTFTQDNLYTDLHKLGFKTAISGYNWFEKLVPQDAITDHFYTPGEDRIADDEVVAAAMLWLQTGQDQFILIHLDQVDYAGHYEGGVLAPGWNEASKRADDIISKIMSTLDLSKDTIIICSDHGHVNPGGHGGNDSIAKLEPFVIAGAGIKPGNYGDINQVDVAPTLAALFGSNIPASTQGRVLTEMLALSDSTLVNVATDTTLQQTQLLETYAAAIGKPLKNGVDPSLTSVADFQKVLEGIRSNKLLGERIPRAILAGLLFAGVVVWFLKFAGKKMGILTLFSVANIGIAVLGYGIMTKWVYSFSTLNPDAAQTQMILFSAGIALVSSLTLWLVYMLTQKAFKTGALSAAFSSEGLTWSLLLVIAVPMLINVTLNGFLPTWTLPNISASFIGLLAMLQLVLLSLFGLILMGISALVAKLSKK
jgi:hypothetical protein